MKAASSRLTRIVPILAAPILVALLSLSGCKKQEAAPVVVAPLHAPATQADDKGWEAYFQDVISRNSQGVTERTNAYYLPAPNRSDYDGMYQRQLQGVVEVVERGVLPHNMLAFMSPDSTKMGDLVVAAFKGASQGSMKDVVILFVGKEADDDRVHAAVANTGCIYRFVEAK